MERETRPAAQEPASRRSLYCIVIINYNVCVCVARRLALCSIYLHLTGASIQNFGKVDIPLINKKQLLCKKHPDSRST